MKINIDYVKNLHIFPYEIFSFDYIKTMCRCFDSDEHVFYIYGEKPDSNIASCENINANIIFEEKSGFGEAKELYRLIERCDKVIFHSLFLPMKILIVLSWNIKKYNKKLFLNIWGGDLYNVYWNRNNSLANWIEYKANRRIAENSYEVGYIKSDYRFLKKIYPKAAPVFRLEGYCYEFEGEIEKEKKHKGTNILLGNSATETCRHKDALDIIKKNDNDDTFIYCVLSYPKNIPDYIDEIISYGKNSFGERFIPLLDFMTSSDYMNLLSNMDVAIFNHNRQQALGNIASLLYLGKRVFVSEENGCLEYFKDMGAVLYSIDEYVNYKDDSELFEYGEHNRQVIETFYSDEQFIKRWSAVLA